VNLQAQSDQRRWLLKAVREAAGELFGQFYGISERALCWRPEPDEWCLKEIAAHLRDAEALYARQIGLIAHRSNPRLPYEAVDVLPYERAYRDEPLDTFVYEFEAAREETVWLLRMLDEEDWERRGDHPYRGQVTIYDIAREVHEHDLEHLAQARRLRELVNARFR
jgi:hypothetical protein